MLGSDFDVYSIRIYGIGRLGMDEDWKVII